MRKEASEFLENVPDVKQAPLNAENFFQKLKQMQFERQLLAQQRAASVLESAVAHAPEPSRKPSRRDFLIAMGVLAAWCLTVRGDATRSELIGNEALLSLIDEETMLDLLSRVSRTPEAAVPFAFQFVEKATSFTNDKTSKPQLIVCLRSESFDPPRNIFWVIDNPMNEFMGRQDAPTAATVHTNLDKNGIQMGYQIEVPSFPVGVIYKSNKNFDIDSQKR